MGSINIHIKQTEISLNLCVKCWSWSMFLNKDYDHIKLSQIKTQLLLYFLGLLPIGLCLTVPESLFMCF